MTEEATTLDEEKAQFIEDGPTLPMVLTDDLVAKFEKGIASYKRWMAACYRLTRESHWLARKGKFSLQGPGAEALMNPLGISYEKPTFRKESQSDDKGEFYAYWCEGYAESKTLGRRGYYLGYCDSRDEFFNARPGWNPKTGEGDVKKSAMTNFVVNVVTRIAGIRDPSPESLQAAGLDLSKIQGIDYRGDKTAEQAADKISEAQAKRLYAIAKGKNVSDDAIHAHLKKNYSIESTRDIKKKDYDSICSWAQAGGPPEERIPGQEG